MIMDKRKFNGGNKNAGRKPKSEEIAIMVERLSPLEAMMHLRSFNRRL